MSRPSSLQLQLRAAANGAERTNDRAKQSLLFKPSEAAHMGVDVIHQVACNGLLELQRLDERLVPYTKTLFNDASKSIHRDTLDSAAEAKLNTALQVFLSLLSPYILLRPTHKVLEYLVRVYRVNELNKDDLLHAALPYHTTRIFGMLAKLCLGRYASGMARAEPYWAVLGNARKKGTPVGRATLVTYCATAPGIVMLRAVAENINRASVLNIESKTHIGFYAALVTEVIETMGTPSDPLLQQVLPYVATGLQQTSQPEYVAASLVIAAQIAAAAQLTAPVQKALIEAVAKAACNASVPSIRQDAIRCLIVVFQRQQPAEFPTRAFADLSRVSTAIA
jgi:U3 small nucleolar RNA-associated protein 10